VQLLKGTYSMLAARGSNEISPQEKLPKRRGETSEMSSIVSPELGLHKSVLNRTRAIISCNEPNEIFVHEWYPGHQSGLSRHTWVR
jgi:hypothetical protein